MGKRRNLNKFISSVLLLSLSVQQSMTMHAMANPSNITGITPVGGANGEFNITPSMTKGDVGFRHYTNFKLAEQDIANLIFKYGQENISQFVNLVDNRIEINGIINTMRDNNFYNGNAIFVSPNGMIVGASGVLNVGSLTAISPNINSYLKYTGFYMGSSYMQDAANALGADVNLIQIPGINDDVNLKLLKESDMAGDIIINGKIFARDSVELIGKNVVVGNTDAVKAGVFAGLPTVHDEKIITLAQADNLFNTLVNNNIQQGTGFDRDALGNVIIKAQSIKETAVSVPDRLVVAGISYGLEELFEIVGGKLLVKVNLPNGLTAAQVLASLSHAKELSSPADASDPSALNGAHAAKVDISNAVIGGKNVDINAVSKTTFVAQKGHSIFERAVNDLFIDENTSSDAEKFINSFAGGTSSFNDFEGARAGAYINIGDNTTLFATKDVDVKALALSDVAAKMSSIKQPMLDTTSEAFYYLGAHSEANVIVQSAAELIAGEDVNLIAATKNNIFVKIKNPTAGIGNAGQTVANIPSIQTSVLQTVAKADTNVVVEKGAKINAGKDVNAIATNVTSDQTILKSLATVVPSMSNQETSGLAVAVNLKESEINTSVKVDGDVIAGNDANFQAQSLRLADTQAIANVVEPYGMTLTGTVAGKVAESITNLLSNKISGISEALDSICSVTSKLPSVSVGVVSNSSNINTSAIIGKSAVIDAINDINVIANTVELATNFADAAVEIPESALTNTSYSYIPSPGLALILNEQNNHTIAQIEDGDASGAAKLTAGNSIKVEATTEQPMNDSTFTLALNLVQTGNDIADLFNRPDTAYASFSDENWDYRVLLGNLTAGRDELKFDINNLILGFKNNGITSNLGLQGFFNNWAQSTSQNQKGVGLAASVIVSDIINETQARVGNYATLNANNALINAANRVVQFNAAGDVGKLWELTSGVKAGSGIGGTVLIESLDNTAKAEVGDNASIVLDKDLDVLSATDQDYLTLVMTGSKATTPSTGLAVSGSTIVQQIDGETKSSIGASRIKAKNLNLKAGEAKISKVPDALEQLQNNPFADLDSNKFETTLEPDMSSSEVKRFTNTDIGLGIDSELGYNPANLTDVSVLTGTGLATLNPSETIKDSVSNIIISGALARQEMDSNIGGSSSSSSSGIAVGASVNVSLISREVNATIADNAQIQLSEGLNVLADTKNQNLNVAIAGAFSGGVDMHRVATFVDQAGTKLKYKSQKYLPIAQWSHGKINGILGKFKDAPRNSGKIDEKGNPYIDYKGVEYKPDLNGQYYDPNTGTVLKDSNGNPITVQNSGLNKNSTATMPTLPNQTTNNATGQNTALTNMSTALAGGATVMVTDSKVNASVGKADIVIGQNANVKATQTTNNLNISSGVSKGSTVGAGASANIIDNSNSTSAIIDGAIIKFTDSSINNLNVNAKENNYGVQVAIGVGASVANAINPTSGVAVGGSFNSDVLMNSVIAEVKNATLLNSNNIDNLNINVTADNYSESYKGAGGMNINIASSTGTVGAAMAGNINATEKVTSAKIENSDIKNAKSVKVLANSDKNKPTEKFIDISIGGGLVAGGSSSYTFDGAMSTNVFLNTVTAEILNNTKISSNNTPTDISVLAYNDLSNWSAAGTLGLSLAQSGAGVGVGSIVNVLNNTTRTQIAGSDIQNFNKIELEAYSHEDLNSVAANLGFRNGVVISPNGIVNVVLNAVTSEIVNSTLVGLGDINVNSNSLSDIFAVTGLVQAAMGNGFVFGANVVSNNAITDNIAKITNSNITSLGNLSVNAQSEENVELFPVGVAVGQTAAVAANISSNVGSNLTHAYIEKSTISANDISVKASDISHTRSRGGTVAGSGNTAVAGSILSDVFIKDIDAHISETTITSSGDILVDSIAKNIFGAENPGGITASDIATDVANGSYNVENDLRFDKWDMSYDISGASTAAVSGSLVSKAVANEVKAYIGSNTDIKEAGDISVKAENITHSSAIVGNVAGSGTAAVGSSLYLNVNTSNVEAYITEGSKLGSNSKVGKVNVDATSEQIYNALNFGVGGSGAAAVNGSLISNIVVNETNAYVSKDVVINSNGTFSVDAKDDLDIQATQLLVSGSGTVAVSAVGNVNVLNNKVSAIVGKNSDTETSIIGSIIANGDININSTASQNYQANIISVSGSGVVAPNAIALSNTMASEVASGIEEIKVESNNGSISVNSNNAYNEKHKNQTSGVREFLNSWIPQKNASGQNSDVRELTADDLNGVDYIPLVAAFNISGSGTVSVSGIVVNNNVITEVDSYVRNADVKSTDGFFVNANSQMTTYDAVSGLAIAGTGANVAASGVINVYSGSTKSEVLNSKVDGSLDVSAEDDINLNTITFMASAGLVGAAVTPVINSNTVVNNVIARVVDTNITNASNFKINAKNEVLTTNAVVSGTAEIVGGAVGVVPITNVFVGSTEAYADNTIVSGDSVVTEIKATDHIDTSSFVGGVAFSAVGANVSGYALTNVFDNDLNAYLNNVSITNGSSTKVNAYSDLDSTNVIFGGGLNGIGASVQVNSLVNVIDNNVNSYISNSTLQKGTVDVLANQLVGISNNTGSLGINGVGNTTIINSFVNVLTNNVNSYIDNTSGTELSNINIIADSYEFLSNNNYGAVISGTAATSANAIVNVLENTTHAFVDVDNKNLQSSGKLKVKANDLLEMTNHMGLIAGSIFGSGGANVNVNVLNNSVKAEVLSQTDGQIEVGSLQINSNSEMVLDEQLLTTAGGLLVGVAGGVIVNSIGSKVNTNNSDLQGIFLDESLSEANKGYNKNVSNITYQKGNNTKTLSGRYSLTGSSDMVGTISNLSANVKTTQASSGNEIDIQAKNIVKGKNSDTLELNNYLGSAGAGSASAAVIVHDVEYNTSARISGGQIESINGDMLVKASSATNVAIESIDAKFGIIGLSGNVGYIKNNAITEAIISSADIESRAITIDSSSLDNIKTDISSYSISGVAGAAAVSKVTSTNKVLAKITGNNVDITTDALDITSSNTSKLSSELQSYYVSGVELNALVNEAKSDAIINALIDATGTLTIKDSMNILATSDGITVDSTVNLGSATLLSGNVIHQKSTIESDFKAGIDNNNLNVLNSGSTVIKSGVQTSNTNKTAEMKAEIKASNSTITLVDVAVGENMTAEVNATTEAISNAKQHTAKSINLLSKLKRTATAGSSSESLGAVTLNFINLFAKANGSNKVKVSGNHNVNEKISLELNDDASSLADMVNASLTLGSGTGNDSLSEVDTKTNIEISGNVNAKSLNIKNIVERNVKNTAETGDMGFVSVNEYSLQTLAKGESTIDLSAKMLDNSFENSVDIASEINNYVESVYSEDTIALVAIGKNNNSRNEISASNKINVKNADINSTGKFNINSIASNSAVMKKNSGGIGFVVITDGDLSNKINAGVNVAFDRSKINAKDIRIFTTSELGSANDPETKYTVAYSDAGIHHDYATISNTVTQDSNIDLSNSELKASDDMVVKMNSDSVFKQSVDSDGQAFVAKNNATSNLTVNNSNTLSLDSNSKLSAHNVYIAMDSNNDLSSKVDIDVSHFGGRDPIGTANLTLSINNAINNSGTIASGENVNIDFMNSSKNDLVQKANVIIEAAIATGGAKGTLTQNINNSISIPEKASINAGKNVSIKYLAGTTSQESLLYTKKISRILLGIPITDTDRRSSAVQNIDYSMDLDGEIIAGSGARKYMKIDKDGNIVTEDLKGFTLKEYSILNSGTLDGATRTQEAIDELNEKIQDIDSQIATLENEELKYQTDLDTSEDNLAKLGELRDFTNSTDYIVEADALELAKTNVKTLVVDENDANKVSQTTFDKIVSEYNNHVNEQYNNQDEIINIQTFESFLNNFVVSDAVYDSNGALVQDEVKLTNAQISTIISAIELEKQKIQRVTGIDIVLYDNKLVVQSVSRYQERLEKLNTTIDNLTKNNERLSEVIDSYSSQIAELNNEKTEYSELITYLQQNPLDTVDVEKSAIEFSAIQYIPGKITLSGIKNYEVTGTGDFKSFSPNVIIDNYSNKDLIFNCIDFGSNTTAGLNIYNKNYYQYANTLKQVNSTISEFDQISDTVIGSTVHYIIDGGISNNDKNNFIVNNYFDHSNPTLTEAQAVPSNITFNGYISIPNRMEVLNDSGNITLNSSLTASSKNFIATQGDFVFNSPSSNLLLAIKDKIFAGRNVNINANKLENNGSISAGYSDRNLEITESMLTNLIVDPTTGKKNMINWGGTEKSAYLANKNNIKAIYEDGKIQLFNTKQEGGNVTIRTSQQSQAGQISTTEGFATVSIVNRTNKELVVNDLENNRMIPTGSSAISSNANTTVDSVGKVTIAGNIINGKNSLAIDGVNNLSITSENGIEVADRLLGGIYPAIDAIGDVELNNEITGAIAVNSMVKVNNGDLSISNNGVDTVINSFVQVENGNVDIVNENGKLLISNTVDVLEGNTSIINSGSENIILADGAKITNKGVDTSIEILSSNSGITVEKEAVVSNSSETSADNLKITNEGNSLLSILGKIFNKKGNTQIVNDSVDGGVLIGENAEITSNLGDLNVTNKGNDGIVSSGLMQSKSGNVTIVNEGANGIDLSTGSTTKATGSSSKIAIKNTPGAVIIGEGAEVTNISDTNEDNLQISNTGDKKISILGKIFNKLGNTTIADNNAGIKVSTTGSVITEIGNTLISNLGSEGIDVEGLLHSQQGNITIKNENSNLEIGEYDSDNDNYIFANGDITIEQTNGSIINGIIDTGSIGNNQNHDLGNLDKAYKTLVSTTGNFDVKVNSGNIGSDTKALSGAESGYGIDASTRDYTESININVAGIVTAQATNNNNALINLRAKDSDMRINTINSDGNIMLTVADWKQADQRPVPTDEAYYHGYSVINSAVDDSISNVIGKNISIISSDNIGVDTNIFTYTQLPNGSISLLAENDLYIAGEGASNHIHEMITKRGDIKLDFDTDTEISKINIGGKLVITSTAKNLTIYEIGSSSSDSDLNPDLLYPHDDISITGENGLVPDQIEIYVLDTNQANPEDANSTLNIYSAYLKGADNGNPDVKLRADNIIAHAYDAPSSKISTHQNPNGFNAKAGRTYNMDGKDKVAEGFNTVGTGKALTFDIQGVSPEDVINAGVDQGSRDYYSQNPVDTIPEFTNLNAFDEAVYKVYNLSLSLNSADNSPIDNRGMQLNHLYVDNAYVDTKDLTLNLIDGYVTNYAEFTNGNRGATSGGYPISSDYRWLNVVDNDFKRNLANIYDTPITSQLYTAQTGSFALSMGNNITQYTTAPVIVYTPDNAVNTFSTENSFYRLTYKDDKIQNQSLTNFADKLEKENKNTDKRNFIRFAVNHEKGIVNVTNIIPDGESKVLAVHNISRGGLLVTHDGTLKLNDKFSINLKYYDIDVDVEVKVVRLHSDKAALEFINMDDATANKILYLNMSAEAEEDINVKTSKL